MADAETFDWLLKKASSLRSAVYGKETEVDLADYDSPNSALLQLKLLVFLDLFKTRSRSIFSWGQRRLTRLTNQNSS